MSFKISVVVATFNRGSKLIQLLEDLAAQSLAKNQFEVVVVDDGSQPSAQSVLRHWQPPVGFAFTLLTQNNQGPAAARHKGIHTAQHPIVVILDDDMRIGPNFLLAHQQAHQQGAQVVMGLIAPSQQLRQLPLFERFHAFQLAQFVEKVANKQLTPSGVHVCSGNVSFRRSLYQQVGGFNLQLRRSEDRDLGLKFEQAKARFVFCPAARSEHESDHTSTAVWLRRAYAYGFYDTQIGRNYAEIASASPWSFVAEISTVSKLLVLIPLLWPSLGHRLSCLVFLVSQQVDRWGYQQAAIAGATLAYGLAYFRGVRSDLGSIRNVLKSYRQYCQRFAQHHPLASWQLLKTACKQFVHATKADHHMLWHYEHKYHQKHMPTRRWLLLKDASRKIGFQMMCAVRLMHLFRDSHLEPLAQAMSRCIRHVYGADIHWNAQFSPGVVIVHGMGLVVSHQAYIGEGCILFQRVTLGQGIDAVSRQVGAPKLEEQVHVGPNSTLLGPIVVGKHSKIASNLTLSQSIPEHTLVSSPLPIIGPRK